MDGAPGTIAWSSSSREARTGVLLPTHSLKNANGWGTAHRCVEQTLAGGSHGRTASHPFRQKGGEWTGHGAPLRGADARGRLARAYCVPPIR